MRLESEAGVYHVLNRGNYRTDIFRSDRTKAAFLQCVTEACERTGWRVHAWCIMSNHYHLAISTPRANLVEGMCWLQGTFAIRFNRFRQANGHLFQGRYKSLVVDPHEGLGPLSHYIHLNPVRAGICPVAHLLRHPWCSARWLSKPGERPGWYDPLPALWHAGQLADTPAGISKYLEYLTWLAEDEPTRKRQRFDRMSRGWIIGSNQFAKAMMQERQELTGCGPRLALELREAKESLWLDALYGLLRQLNRKPSDLTVTGKSADWKLAVAATLKARTTVTNRWLGQKMHLGALHEVSRKVTAWNRTPDLALLRKLQPEHHKPQSAAP